MLTACLKDGGINIKKKAMLTFSCEDNLDDVTCLKYMSSSACKGKAFTQRLPIS